MRHAPRGASTGSPATPAAGSVATRDGRRAAVILAGSLSVEFPDRGWGAQRVHRIDQYASRPWGTTTTCVNSSLNSAVVHGRVVLSSGREADWYVDLRRVALHYASAPLVGRVMLDADLRLGLRRGGWPDPRCRPGGDRDAPCGGVNRASGSTRSWSARRPRRTVCNAGSRVLTLPDDACWSWKTPPRPGESPLTAVEALREAGAEVVGVAVIVDRGAGDAIRAAGLPYKAAYSMADLGLVA